MPFYSLSGSAFVEMYVGVGASRVRDLFKQAQQMAPCIIFIDEIDAIGKSRDNQMGGNDEREQTLNQMLAEMDGFESNKGLVLLAATNRPEILDPALLRPGRFDRRIIVEKPDLKGRVEVLKVHSKDVKMDETVNLEEIALAVGDSMKIFVDGGIRSGVDVFKALALGADAVIIARPFVTAVYGGAEEGVKSYIEKLGTELEDTMKMCGVTSLEEIDRDCVWTRS